MKEEKDSQMDKIVWMYGQMVNGQIVLKEIKEYFKNISSVELLYGKQIDLYEKLFTGWFQKFPVSLRYQINVCKGIISILEDCGCELYEPLLEMVAEFMAVKSLCAEYCYQTFRLMGKDPIFTLRVADMKFNKVGVIPWEAGMILAQFIYEYKHMFDGKSVLELGAGVGITGILLEKMVPGVKSIHLTDFDDQVLENLKHNVNINKCNPEITKVSKLDWTCEEHIEKYINPVDIILIADCVYATDLILPLIKVVDKVLKLQPNASALFATTRRNLETFKKFCDQLAKFDIYLIDETVALSPLVAKSQNEEKNIFKYDNIRILLNKTPDLESIRFFRATKISPSDPNCTFRFSKVTRFLGCSCCDETIRTKKFQQLYMKPNFPCLIDNVDNSTYFSQCADLMVKQNGNEIDIDSIMKYFGDLYAPVVGSQCNQPECQTQQRQHQETPGCGEMQIKSYFNCWKTHRSPTTSPGYLKDWHMLRDSNHAIVSYETPPFFKDDWLNWYLHEYKNDDYKFVYCGPSGSKTLLHHDVYTSFSWSFNLTGAKLWLLFSPNENIDQIKISSQFEPQLLKRCNILLDRENTSKQNPTTNAIYTCFVAGECYDEELSHILQHSISGNLQNVIPVIQKSNQAIFIPSNWYHQVYNIQDTLSINHNWFNGYNIEGIHKWVLSEYEKTKFALRDIPDDKHNQKEATVQNIMKLNSGINIEEFKHMLNQISSSKPDLSKDDKNTIHDLLKNLENVH